MNAIYASLICIAGALICAVLKQTRPEQAMAAAMAAGIAAVAVCFGDLRRTADALRELSDISGTAGEYSGTLLKAYGVALIAEFAVQICADAGESALAGRIKLALRLTLTVLALPLLTEVVSQSMRLLEF